MGGGGRRRGASGANSTWAIAGKAAVGKWAHFLAAGIPPCMQTAISRQRTSSQSRTLNACIIAPNTHSLPPAPKCELQQTITKTCNLKGVYLKAQETCLYFKIVGLLNLSYVCHRKGQWQWFANNDCSRLLFSSLKRWRDKTNLITKLRGAFGDKNVGVQ